ncbi:MAG TPA: hypothetical protein VH062_33145 [Polyangiaceae bacterium]|nr:hypothetical protein [Polyangiaceae bacterium]
MKRSSAVFLLALGGCVAHVNVGAAAITVAKDGDAWWFKDASGKRFVAQGVVHVTYDGDGVLDTGRKPYREAVETSGLKKPSWAEQTVERMRAWGFNSVGAWSDGELNRFVPHTLALNFQKVLRTGKQPIIDVFSSGFETAANAYAAEACKAHLEDDELIGYFSDNELRWGPDWRGKEELLELYLALPDGAPGRAKAEAFLRSRYPDVEKLGEAWDVHAPDFAHAPRGYGVRFEEDVEAFAGMVADRYFTVVAAALHAADPKHLFLGTRFQTVVPPRDAVLHAAGAADVVSINVYGIDPTDLTERAYALSQKPVLISEFAFRADDAGLPNSKGAGPRVRDQKERAAAYAHFVSRLMALPEAVGYQWFQWSDEPREGRPGGENSNYGLVTIKNEPYAPFVSGVKAANLSASKLHGAAKARTATPRGTGATAP